MFDLHLHNTRTDTDTDTDTEIQIRIPNIKLVCEECGGESEGEIAMRIHQLADGGSVMGCCSQGRGASYKNPINKSYLPRAQNTQDTYLDLRFLTDILLFVPWTQLNWLSAFILRLLALFSLFPTHSACS